MKKSSEFANILDECLERLVKGESVEQCLQSYPEQAAQLEPLLKTAQAVRQVSAILPRAEFKARTRYEFRAALQEETTKKRLPLFGARPWWVMALMVASILLLAGGGTAAVASNSMPDSPLYSVKLAAEEVQLALTPSEMGKARLCAVLADRRVAEIVYMTGKGDAQRVEIITQHLDSNLKELAILASVEKVEGTPVEPVPEVLTEEPAMMPAEEAAPLAPSEETEESVVAPPPAPAPAPAAGSSEEPSDDKGILVKDSDRAKLKVAVANCAADHLTTLRQLLKKAPESARPALRRAIAVSEAGYGRALEALD